MSTRLRVPLSSTTPAGVDDVPWLRRAPDEHGHPAPAARPAATVDPFPEAHPPSRGTTESGVDALPADRHFPRRVGNAPEPWVLLFSLLLNYPWEFLQVPFFEGMRELPHWEGVQMCSLAAVGDAVIALVAFWAAAAVSRSRRWLMQPWSGAWLIYLGAGLAITMAMEWLATEAMGRWRYAALMPTAPGLGTGVVPLLQWLILPPLVVFLARGQLRGQRRAGEVEPPTRR